MGASVLAAPWLSLLENHALGAESTSPGTAKRLVIFFSPNGTVHEHWRPTGSGTSFSFPVGSVLEPLQSHKSDLIVCDGLDFKGVANHEPGMSAMLTGGGGANTLTGGRSLDQYVAAQVGVDSKFPSLDLGVATSAWGASNQTRMSYAGPGLYVAPDDKPMNVYERMFGPVFGGGQLPVDKAMLRRKSVLDLLRGEIHDLRQMVGQQERIKLDAHLDALETVEKGLVSGGDCAKPEAPSLLNPKDNGSFPQLVKTQTDLMVLALACGMTQVASLQCSHTVSPVLFSWLGMTDDHHALSHKPDSDPTGVQNFVLAERWFAEQFAYLIQKLKDTPEPTGDGTLFDNTCVLWAKELGDGRMHDCLSVPFVLAGSAGGYFQTGKYLQFNGEPHQKLLVSVCHAMGLNNPTFGDPSHGVGGLDGLS